MTHGQDEKFIHLYEGHFTTEFLRMLDEPMTARRPTNAPTINRRKIPYKPFETFVDRIQPQALDAGDAPEVPVNLDGAIHIIDQVAQPSHEQNSEKERNMRCK